MKMRLNIQRMKVTFPSGHLKADTTIQNQRSAAPTFLIHHHLQHKDQKG